jgi:hypothetical protein
MRDDDELQLAELNELVQLAVRPAVPAAASRKYRQRSWELLSAARAVKQKLAADRSLAAETASRRKAEAQVLAVQRSHPLVARSLGFGGSGSSQMCESRARMLEVVALQHPLHSKGFEETHKLQKRAVSLVGRAASVAMRECANRILVEPPPCMCKRCRWPRCS